MVFSRSTLYISSAPYLMRSFDGGNTWAESLLICDADTPSWTTYDLINYASGRLNIAGVTIGSNQFDNYNVETKYSDNLGINWTNPHFWFQRDQTGAGRGMGIAVAETLFYGFLHSGGHNYEIIDSIKTAVSYNNGISWGPLRQVIYQENGNYLLTFAYSLGRIHLIYQEFSENNPATEVYYIFSDDWGETWSIPIVVSDDAIDHSQWPSISSSDDGRVIVTWFDYKYGSGHGGFTGDILYRFSSDNGLSWGEESRLTTNQEGTSSRAFIAGNKIGIVWEDYRTGFTDSELYYTESTDNGQSWSQEFKLTSAFGMSTYQRLTVQADKLYLVWGDARNNPQFDKDVYFRRADDVVGIEEDNTSPIPNELSLSAYPNPFNDRTTITTNESDIAVIVIYDISGRLIATLKTSNGQVRWEAEGYSSGIYIAKTISGDKASTIKLVLLK